MAYIIACCFLSCSPGKKLLQDQAALDQLASNQAAHDKAVAARAVEEFTKNNPCPPGPVINLDSLCGLYYQCPDVTYKTPAEDYAGASADQSVTAPGSGPVKPKTVLVPFEDTRRINLLLDSCREKDKRLAAANTQLTTIVAAANAAADEKYKTIKLLMWIFLGVALAEMIGIIIIAKR